MAHGCLCAVLAACGGGTRSPSAPSTPQADTSQGGATALGGTGSSADAGAGTAAVGGTPAVRTEDAGAIDAAAAGASAAQMASAGTGGSPAAVGGSVAVAGSGAGSSEAGARAAAASDAGMDSATCTRSGAATPDTPSLYVIGDSTASVYESNLYPRMGWAQPLQDYFAPACATVRDQALSGRSSKSFYDEGAWTPIRDALHAGDFVLIQFGHNDEKSDDPSRYTEPFSTYQQYLGRYIDDALAKSATPILLTPIERNKWSNGKLSATHGSYPDAVRQLAQMRKLTLVDMTALTHSYFERIGQAATDALFLNLKPGESPNYPNGNSDDTHLQEKGAHAVAKLALDEFAAQHTPVGALER